MIVVTSRRKTVERRVSASLMKSEIGGEALGQRGRALAPDLREIGVDQVAVERRLHVGLDPRHDPVGQDGQREERKALHRGDRR